MRFSLLNNSDAPPSRAPKKGCWPQRAHVVSLNHLPKSRCAPVATMPADKHLYHWQIEATDWQIDALVVQLYGLTEEIAVVEGG